MPPKQVPPIPVPPTTTKTAKIGDISPIPVPFITVKMVVLRGNGILPASPITAKTTVIGGTGIGDMFHRYTAAFYNGQNGCYTKYVSYNVNFSHYRKQAFGRFQYRLCLL